MMKLISIVGGFLFLAAVHGRLLDVDDATWALFAEQCVDRGENGQTVMRQSFYTRDNIAKCSGTPYRVDETVLDLCTSQDGVTWYTYDERTSGGGYERCVFADAMQNNGEGDVCCVRMTSNMDFTCSTIMKNQTAVWLDGDCVLAFYNVAGQNNGKDAAYVKIESAPRRDLKTGVPGTKQLTLRYFSSPDCTGPVTNLDVTGQPSTFTGCHRGELPGSSVGTYVAFLNQYQDSVAQLCYHYTEGCGAQDYDKNGKLDSTPFRCSFYTMGQCLEDGNGNSLRADLSDAAIEAPDGSSDSIVQWVLIPVGAVVLIGIIVFLVWFVLYRGGNTVNARGQMVHRSQSKNRLSRGGSRGRVDQNAADQANVAQYHQMQMQQQQGFNTQQTGYPTAGY